MKQEHKELLLRDLCARLPYKVIVDYGYNAFDVRKGRYVKHGSKCILTCSLLDVFMSPRLNEKGEYIKPYLFPLSSMTDDQYDQLYIDSRVKNDSIDIFDALANDMDAINWLNKNHFSCTV